MKNSISDLYEKYIDDIYSSITYENLKISKKVLEFENILLSTLNQEQKELLNKISNLENDRTDLITKETFKFAYSLATNLIVESLKNHNENITKNSTK